MSVMHDAGHDLVLETRPLLEQQDADALARHLRAHWPTARLRALLTHHDKDTVRIALVCLACCGTMEDVRTIVPLLADDDEACSAVAEHAMWAIWFRAGDVTIDRSLSRAVNLIDESRLREALDVLDDLIRLRPTLAEAYNQRAIAYFLLDDHVRSMHSYRKTMAYNPYHFGAWAGLGHCHASLGQFDLACAAYREALRIHPRLDGIRQCLDQIQHRSAGQHRPALHVAPECLPSAAFDRNPPSLS